MNKFKNNIYKNNHSDLNSELGIVESGSLLTSSGHIGVLQQIELQERF